MSDHQIEPELLHPTPRRVALRGGPRAAMGTGCVRLFILPHMLAGVFLVGLVIHTAIVAAIGPIVPGRIVARYYTQSKNGMHLAVCYAYTVGGRTYTSTDRSSAGAAHPMGDAVRVQVSPILPGVNSRIDSEGASAWLEWLKMVPIMLFWNAILSVFVYVLYIAPILRRSLTVYGTAGLATVIDKKRTGNGRNLRYQVDYEYTPVLADGTLGAPVRDFNYILHPRWQSVHKGDTVTVIYRPRPFRTWPYTKVESSVNSVLYPFGPYIVRMNGELA